MFHSLKNEMIQQWDNSNFIYYIVYSDNIRTILYFVPLQMDFIPETNWDRDLNAPGAQGSRGTCSEHGSAGPSRSDFAKSLGLGDTTWLFCSNEKGRWLRNKQEKGDILTSWLGVFFFVCSVSPDLSWNKNDIRKRLWLGCHRGDTSQCLGRQTKPFWEKTTEKQFLKPRNKRD